MFKKLKSQKKIIRQLSEILKKKRNIKKEEIKNLFQ